MSGVMRTDKPSRTAKFYERKVRFHTHTDVSESTFAATPVKLVAPALISGAEKHKREKRKGTRKARHRSGGSNSTSSSDNDLNAFLNRITTPYPRTPVRKTRVARRHTLPTDILTDEYFADLASGGPSSSPCGKIIGMPDITDFSEPPDCPFEYLGIPKDPYPSPKPEILPLENKVCRCGEMEQENRDLRGKYEALYQEHQKLLSRMEQMRTQLVLNGIRSRDDMMFDTDEFTSCQSSVSTYPSSSIRTPSSSRQSLTSTPSPIMTEAGYPLASPVIAEAGTPAGQLGMPTRVIDEDYDEGYDASAVRLEQARLGVLDKVNVDSDMTMEETVNLLADDVSARWRISDTFNASDSVVPGVAMPSVPRFQF